MPDLELSCNVCGTDLFLEDATPLRLEHATDVWERRHGHSAEERESWYRSVKELARMDEFDEDED